MLGPSRDGGRVQGWKCDGFVSKSESCENVRRKHHYGSSDWRGERAHFSALPVVPSPHVGRPALLDILLVVTRGGQDRQQCIAGTRGDHASPRSFIPTTWFPPADLHPQMNAPHVETESLGFPTGYFSIKSIATGRLLEIYNNETKDNSPLALWPAKEQSLVESASIPLSIRADHLVVAY